MAINVILAIPAATSPDRVMAEFYGEWVDDVWIPGAGYKTEIPPSGVMPASVEAAARALVHCCISDATYQDVKDVAADQIPPWQRFGAQDSHRTINPDYDPTDPDSEQMILIEYKPINVSVWNFLPDDDEGNPQTQLHQFQGHVPWPSR